MSSAFSAKLLGRLREFVGVFCVDLDDPLPNPSIPFEAIPLLFSSLVGTQHFAFWQRGASISGAFGQPEIGGIINYNTDILAGLYLT